MNPIFIERMKQILKDEYPLFEQALKQKQVKALYLNSNKNNLNTFISQYALKQHHMCSTGYYFDHELYPLGKHPFHDCGLYYIQEPSAMLVGTLLHVEKGDKVLDMCAAPGGKTCFVASALKDTGVVIANDINASRASILSSNVERFGLKNTIVTNTTPKMITDQLPEFFDKIILDAPCSGEGMFRKLDLAIDTWSLDKVNDCARIQRELVTQAYHALKPGGQLIYSTCTYSMEENEEIVSSILNQYPDMKLIQIPLTHGMQPGIGYPECCRLYPHHHFGEGHFIALFKKEGTPSISKYPYVTSSINKNQISLLNQFYKEHLNIKTPTLIHASNEHLYELKANFPVLNKVKILRQGLYLGECKKGRFEPSYALSHTLTRNDVKRFYQLGSESTEVKKYLKGETLEGTHQKGYGVIFVENYPLSFYKESNGIVKNLIPKGLRKQY